MLTFGSNMNTVSRRAAYVYGIQEGIMKDGKYIYGKEENIGKDLEYEHGKPHESLILKLVDLAISKKATDVAMDKVFKDYVVNIITKKMDKTVTATGRKSKMGAKYSEGIKHGWTQRMFNEENFGRVGVGAITSLDGENTVHGQDHAKITEMLTE